MPSLSKALQLINNMGWRYVSFRAMHEAKVRTGIFKKAFPQDPAFQQFISLAEWKKLDVAFFMNGRDGVDLTGKALPAELAKSFEELKEGWFRFFSSLSYNLGSNYDWITNPDTGFKYGAQKHWTQINDYSQEAGDIKFVWEKSRFSFLYTIIRNDAYTGEDHSEWVWKEILSWIDANPINSGPNYKCSQEISLRVLNWTFALNFYKDTTSLTEDIFQRIIFSIYWQLDHVYKNIDFSRIAVRNNHAITETLTLYLGGLLYPFFPKSALWKEKGKKWFEEEIAYQVYADGTFLQFSMNYHRVVIQLLTWAIRLAEVNKESFNAVVYERAQKSLEFLLSCMNLKDGWLPNYGNNDGALFFKLNDADYRDYRPQLEALSRALGFEWKYDKCEDSIWYGITDRNTEGGTVETKIGLSQFKDGGYYIHRQDGILTFVRCGNHKDRPHQADNLHLDIWRNGINYLHDAGSYKYNTDNAQLKYFMGTQSHNTIMLGDYDQMEKGARFIWYHWSQCESVQTTDNEDYFIFEGTIKAFQHVSKNIRHYRRITVSKKKPEWLIEDRILNKPDALEMHQLWHTKHLSKLNFVAQLQNKEQIAPLIREGYYSDYYGKKELCSEIVFTTKADTISTRITIL
ncbi:alginate lyase family protein [Pontibacter burrus]|uniref:Heparinase n=1 Tax=Pontibacter burrus TaxID=2704466 RepID=A0A6B3LLE1_9BACT|nr:alginate lyase family protein [Pontibacter burrus]NEM97609.1 heparinase [Pontibacter burrus]